MKIPMINTKKIIMMTKSVAETFTVIVGSLASTNIFQSKHCNKPINTYLKPRNQYTLNCAIILPHMTIAAPVITLANIDTCIDSTKAIQRQAYLQHHSHKITQQHPYLSFVPPLLGSSLRFLKS